MDFCDLFLGLWLCKAMLFWTHPYWGWFCLPDRFCQWANYYQRTLRLVKIMRCPLKPSIWCAIPFQSLQVKIVVIDWGWPLAKQFLNVLMQRPLTVFVALSLCPFPLEANISLHHFDPFWLVSLRCHGHLISRLGIRRHIVDIFLDVKFFAYFFAIRISQLLLLGL